jgi:ribosome-associated protein
VEELTPLANRIQITPALSLPLDELSFRFSRAGGPGGQNVNKTETRVELLFDVARSPSLSDWQRARIRERLAGHIDSDGVLHLVASSERSQLRNRQEVVERFRTLLAGALRPVHHRRPTKPTGASRERRLAGKARRSEIKKGRGKVGDW